MTFILLLTELGREFSKDLLFVSRSVWDFSFEIFSWAASLSKDFWKDLEISLLIKVFISLFFIGDVRYSARLNIEFSIYYSNDFLRCDLNGMKRVLVWDLWDI